MTGYLHEFSPEQTRDPYATLFCNHTDAKCYQSRSRDPMRTPMQVSLWQFNSRYSRKNKILYIICHFFLIFAIIFTYFVLFDVQWTNNDPSMWLKYLNCKDDFNVADEDNMNASDRKSKRNPLALFRKLTKLRQFHAIHDGNIFYPLQDREIFAFLR